MRSSELPFTGADLELRVLRRRYEGAVQQRRLEHLGAKLQHDGPLQVVFVGVRFNRSRLVLVLGDGTMLRLKLFWPPTASISTLESVRWRRQIGWWLETADDDGTPGHIVAFDAKVELVSRSE